ncbi:voltage-dependent anion channel [Xylariaceae sp. FL0594]|nr:voltage-dependent anion channel [Xylariaceae sp. FL0594]
MQNESRQQPKEEEPERATTRTRTGDEERPGNTSGNKVGLRERIAHFTWANFTVAQSTGAMAILLSETPRQFHGLQTAGVAVFVLDLVLFVLLCAAMTTRFALHPFMLRRSFINPPEPFYFSTFMVSLETCIVCIQRYGVPRAGPWLVYAVRVLFWIYAAASLLFATLIWVILGAKSPIKAIQIHPAIFLMIINTMLTGTIASAILETQPEGERMPILVAAIAYLGLGWVVSVLLLAWHLASILELGLGPPNQRFGLFMPVGAPGYLMVGLMGCARYVPVNEGVDGYFARNWLAADMLRVVALWTSIFLWLFTFWVFALALLASIPAVLPRRSNTEGYRCGMWFTLSWWGLVFPNVGFALGTAYIGRELESSAIEWVATMMTVMLFSAWLMNLVLYVKALVTGQIMWPGKDEDVIKSE